MMRSLVLLLAGNQLSGKNFPSVVTLEVIALPLTQQNHRRFLTFGRPPWGLGANAPSRRVQGDMTRVAEDWYDQKLDHFDNTSNTTWRQRYWTNNQYYQDGAPAFLFIGGEGPGTGDYISGANGFLFMDIAISHHAYVFDLEHRFYGDSHPTSDMSKANLVKYLNSYQAVEDIAEFITGMNAKYFPGGAPTWVTFGGSYSGSLSSYIRLKHPELVSFAVGSSAPVLAQLDFVGYLEIVRASITDVSADCAASIQQGFQQVATLTQSGSGRETLRTIFNLCEALPASGNNVPEFYSAILSWYMVAVQYAGIEYSLESDICRYHTSTTDPVLTRMKKLNDHFNAQNGQSCTYINFDGYIEFYQDTSYGEAQSDRAWIFQTCNEYGYLGTTDSTQDFWGGGLTVDHFINTCLGIFGPEYNQDHIQAAVDQSNQYFGGIAPASTKVIFPNGSYDPWHGLAILPQNNTNSDNVPLFAIGAAHCGDMYSQSSVDSASMKQVKQSVIDTLNQWLSINNKK